MQINSIINRYIFKEMLPVFFVSVLFFLFLFLMARMLYIVNLVINYNLNFGAVVIIILLTLPSFFTYIVPLSVMLSTLLTTLRLSNDNEILAFKASGLSLYRLLPPVIAFCVLGLLLTMFMTLYLIPKSQSMLISTTASLITTNVNVGLKEQTFNNNFKDVVIYAGEINPATGNMKDIFIEDKRDPEMAVTVSAPRGNLLTNVENQTVSLLLFDGEILQTNIAKKTANDLKFANYEMHFDLKTLFTTMDNQNANKDRREMNLSELKETIELSAELKNSTYYRAVITLYDRFAMPFGCLAMGILVFAVGAQLQVNRKSFSLLLGFIFFLLYYLLYSLGHSMAKKGQVIPWLGLWLPNIVIGILGVYLLIQVANEKELWINRMLLKIHSYIFRLGGKA